MGIAIIIGVGLGFSGSMNNSVENIDLDTVIDQSTSSQNNDENKFTVSLSDSVTTAEP